MNPAVSALLSLSVTAAAVAQNDPAWPEAPRVEGERWQVACSPKLPEIESPPGEVVDHCFFKAADGLWQLWTQIRNTQHGRIFYHWTGSASFEHEREMWTDRGVIWMGDPHTGEMPRVIQAPYCYHEDGGPWWLFYGGGGSICRARSDNGLRFTRDINNAGTSRVLEALANRTPSGMRDPHLLRVGDRRHLYYVLDNRIMGCTGSTPGTDDWSEAVPVTAPPMGSQSPTVIQRGRWFYLFCMGGSGAYRTEVYASENPLDFRPGTGHRVAGLEASASEVIQNGEATYLSSLLPERDAEGRFRKHIGVQVGRLVWERAPAMADGPGHPGGQGL